MAAMSVIGIDFGNESCYVAVARAGGIETVANDYSLRATPSCVAFSGKNRILGVAAKNQMVTNMKNTIHGFKRLLGRKFSDPAVQQELKFLPFRVVETQGGNIGIKVSYLDDDQVFSPEQITAMLFTKLKEIAELNLKTKVNDCVISVPSFFTNAERLALLDAAQIAGLNVLRLMNETLATALAYGIYKQDLPAPEEHPRNVVFVDCGHSSLQAFACAFNKGKLRMLACTSDPQLGGRDFDLVLAEHFCRDFQARYRIDPRTNPRAFLRLLAEVDKLKRQMSANSTKLPMNIECFMEDKDVHGDMKRADMEQLCAHLFQQAERTLRRLLEDCKLRLDEIYAVEVVGGSTRMPAIKQLIEQIFGKPASTTLNQDEAVARGCALQCAMSSPAIKVRDFSISDVQNFPIKLMWDTSLGDGGEMEVFPQNHPVPFSKMLTFFRKEPFSIKAFYSGNIPYPEPFIGQYTIKDVKPAADGESQKVKVKVRLNNNGIFTVSSASLVEKREAGDQDASEEAGAADSMEQDQAQHNHVGPEEDEKAPMPADKRDTDRKKKQLVKTVDLPIDVCSHGFSQADLNSFAELEGKMIANDKQEKERVDARNALEEYVYELRGKLSAEEELAGFVPETEREQLCGHLGSMETWLYEEGEDCNRQTYVDKLTSLRNQGEPIKARRAEWEQRGAVLDDLGASLQLARKAVDQWRAGDERYCHLASEEVHKVEQAIGSTHRWLEEKRQLLAGTPRCHDPAVTVAAIRQERQTFESTVGPVLNKPKPKVEPPPPAQSAEGADGKMGADGDQTQHAQNHQPSQPGEDGMDVE
ncbi:heat shock 70 kDa protein 4 [Bacillus rossius redtenbacheri]|uniref:heat shock 70 kDa protein 4 n=1 Tax=Bacillus rossius redtenbacheri TaxID=93214 RepID=UPI002FDE6139